MGSAKNPFAQEDRKEAFNAYGLSHLHPQYLRTTSRKGPLWQPFCRCIHAEAFVVWAAWCGWAWCSCCSDVDECLAGFETEPDDVKPFHGVNKWPSEEDLPGFRETMEEYHKEMSCIAKRCLVPPPASLSCACSCHCGIHHD